MSDNRENNIFLSYASEDLSQAIRLERELSKVGLKVWFDKSSLKPGVRWEAEIERAIRNSRYFIALMSSKVVGKKGFVQKEIRRALQILDEFPEDEIYIVPVRLDDCKPPHPRLSDLNWTDLFPDWDAGMLKLLSFFSGGVQTKSLATKADGHTTILEGLYVSSSVKRSADFEYRSYLWFFGEMEVAGVSAVGEPHEVASWFMKRDLSDMSKGTYAISENAVGFSLNSSYGSVDYEGYIEERDIVLKTHSRINGNRSVERYSFVPGTDRAS